MPLCPTRLAWAGVTCLPAAAAALPGLGGGRGERARPGGIGQAGPPTQAPAGKVTGRPSPPEDVGAHLSWSTWAIGFLSPVLSFLLRKMGGKSILPAGEMNEMSS